MSKILEMRQKRAEIWEQAKAFLEAHQGDDGVMNTEDTEQYERMEQEVVARHGRFFKKQTARRRTDPQK